MKKYFLDSILLLGSAIQDHHWLLGGDFNMITTLQEKKGGQHRLDVDSEAFKETVEKLRLADIQMSNGCYTWHRRRGSSYQIVMRLDKFSVSKSLLQARNPISTKILPFSISNHFPIMLSKESNHIPRPKPFKFEKF
jgi:exonuclease III